MIQFSGTCLSHVDILAASVEILSLIVPAPSNLARLKPAFPCCGFGVQLMI